MGRIITFEPIQEGTGDPSSDNVRPILPSLNIEGIGDIYGGYVDFDTGVLAEKWLSVSYDGTTDAYRNQSSYQRFSMLADANGRLIYERTSAAHIRCNKLLNVGANGMGPSTYRIAVISAYQIQLKITEEVSTPELLLAWLDENPIHVIVELETPTTYQLTAEQLTEAYNQLVVTPPSMLEKRRRMIMSQPHLTTLSANPLTFQTDISAPVKDCKIYFEPVQEGSGDPSPDNVRPISGWDGVTITRCGKNLVKPMSDTDFWGDGWINSEGIITSRSDYAYTKVPLKVRAGMYIISSSNSSVWKGIYASDMRGNKLGFKESTATSVRLTVSEDALLSVYVKRTGTDVQLECNSAPSAYEPYTGTSITIPFPQTIYGGYVDLVKGEVVEEWVGFTFDGVNKKVTHDYMTNNNKYIRAYWVYWSPRGTNMPSKRISVICDKLPVVRNDSTGISSTPCLYAAGNGVVFGGLVLGTKEDYPDLAEGTKADRISAINAWFAENPTTVVYSKSEQDTKNTYSLSPQTIKTLKGINNIWSDANGSIDIKYWKH